MTETVLFIEQASNIEALDSIDIDGTTVTVENVEDNGDSIRIEYRDDFNEQSSITVDPDHEFSVMGVVD